jgi:hypothetical protein
MDRGSGMNPLIDEPKISLLVREWDEPGVEIRVNFGVFAGRHATPAEIDELAVALRDIVPSFAIVSEERHEFGDAVAASVHQVVIEVPQEYGGFEPGVLGEQILLVANGWALECMAIRHGPEV